MPEARPSRGRLARVGLTSGALLFAALLAAPAPAGLGQAGWRATAVGVLMAVWWVSEALPIAATALVPLVAFPMLRVLPIEATAAPYANPIVFLFLGGFVIAAALERCGLHRRMALAIVGTLGTRPPQLVAGFLVATAFISMWVSNTATAVMMLPIALSILALVDARYAEDPAARAAIGSAILLAVAYGANIGGMGTLIGTPPNALLAGFLAESVGIRISFVGWMLLGVPVVVVSLPIAWLVLTRIVHRVPGAPLPGGAEALALERGTLGRPSRAEWLVGGVTALTAAAWLVRPALESHLPGLSDAGIAVAGALVLFLLPSGRPDDPLVTWAEAERLPWGVLLLFGGGLALAAGLERTGVAAWVGGGLAGLGDWPPFLVAALLCVVVVGFSEFASNTATAAAFLPVAVAFAAGAADDPLAYAVPTALAASAGFALPVGTPPNAVVYGTGRVEMGRMVRAGLLMDLIMIGVIVLASRLLAPLVLGGASTAR